jgi:hypothetical protein
LELKELKDAGFDVMLTGFDQREIDRLVISLEGDAGDAVEEGDIPAVPTRPVSRRGDVWLNTVIHVAPATARRLPRKAAFVGFAGLNKAAMVVAFGMTSRMNSTNWGPGFDVCLAVAAV